MTDKRFAWFALWRLRFALLDALRAFFLFGAPQTAEGQMPEGQNSAQRKHFKLPKA